MGEFNDIAQMLARLHELQGAAFSRQQSKGRTFCRFHSGAKRTLQNVRFEDHSRQVVRHQQTARVNRPDQPCASEHVSRLQCPSASI